jgi:elongation factor 2
MYVSKMVPTTDKGRFFAFGRVFSGKVSTNQTINILGPEYTVGSKVDLFAGKKIQRTVLMQGRSIEQIPDCPCGNLIGLVGVDQFLLKSGTLTTDDNAAPFRGMKFSVSPVVRCAVEVKNSGDLPKLVEGLRRLGKSDPLVHITTTKQGEHIVAGAGELHLEICLKDLRDDFMRGAEITVTDPVVSFCETVCKPSADTVVTKSANKHNRIYLQAEPLNEQITRKIETREIREDDKDPKKRTRILVDEYGWVKQDAQKIWAFGCPPDGRANIFVDCTKGAAFLNEARDHLVGGFTQATSGGVLMDEPWRGVRCNLMDITLHTDAIHRGAGQLSPAARRAFFGCELNSGPRISEPIYLCDITVPQGSVSGVYQTLASRRGKILPEEDEQRGPLMHVKCFLPVLESFGFTSKLRQATAGKAFPQMIFDHWELVDGESPDAGSIYDEKTKTHQIMMDVRKRKGMKLEVPDFNDYFDRI